MNYFLRDKVKFLTYTHAKLMGIVGNSSEKCQQWKEGLLQYFKIKQFLIKNCDIFGLIRCVNKYCISLNYTILIEPRMRTSCFITRYRPWSPGWLQITFCSHIQCSRRSPSTKSCERKKNALIVIKQKESFKSDIIARLKSYFISLLSPSRLLFGFAWQHGVGVCVSLLRRESVAWLARATVAKEVNFSVF